MRLFKEFTHGPGYVHVSSRTVDLAQTLIPKMLALCPRLTSTPAPKPPDRRVLSDPDRVLARLDAFIGAYGARATLFETWASNPTLFELLIWLFDRSEFFAEIAIRTPDLVDELELSGRLRGAKPPRKVTTQHGRRQGSKALDSSLSSSGIYAYRAAGNSRLWQISNRIWLSCPRWPMPVLHRPLGGSRSRQYQKPETIALRVIGLRKLGGQELELRLGSGHHFCCRRIRCNLPKLQKMAVEVMDLLSVPTNSALAFVTDARLRPNGEKGLFGQYPRRDHEEYYRQRAQSVGDPIAYPLAPGCRETEAWPGTIQKLTGGH